MKQLNLLKESLEKATTHYQKYIHLAEGYLATRGITLQDAHTARLGLVAEPLTGHEQFINRLAIPYITPTGIVDIRFRSIDGSEPKYLGMPGSETRLYNVTALRAATDYIAVCEGEIDAITLTQKCGIPSIGVPGANNWKPHYTMLLHDYDKIFIFADGDQPGSDFAKKLAREISNITIVNMPDGEDVNSYYNKYGSQFFTEKVNS